MRDTLNLLFVAALLTASCDTPTPSSLADATAGDAESGAAANVEGGDGSASQDKPWPELTLSVNGGRTTTYSGWPVVIEAALFFPPNRQADGSPKVRVQVESEQGVTQNWPLHPYVAAADPSIKADAPLDFAWWLGPEESAQLTPGKYRLSAVLEPANAGADNAAQNRATSTTVVVTIQPEPASLTPRQAADKLLRLASYELLRGNPQQALARIDELLSKFSDDYGGWEYRGDLLAHEGKTASALEAYNRAVTEFRKAFRRLPPATLLEKHREQLNKLIVAGRIDEPAKPTGPLEVAFLSADAAGGGKYYDGPIPASAERLSFVWKLTKPVPAEPVEALWIAASDGREIGRKQSEPGAASGEFTLPVPSGGFPAGAYRLELRQVNQLLHTEPFTITSPVGRPAATPSPATAAGKNELVAGWGTLVDPAGDCRAAAADGGTLTLTVPGTEHNLNPTAEYGNVLAPRVLQPVEGDFQLQVRVAPFARPQAGTSTTKQGHSYVAAGIVVWQDEKTFVRWMRAANGERGDLFVHAEAFLGSQRVELKILATSREVPDEATHLRAERRYGRIKLSWSRDGESWTSFAQLPDDGLAKQLHVGIAAVNSTTAVFAPVFDSLQQTPAASKP